MNNAPPPIDVDEINIVIVIIIISTAHTCQVAAIHTINTHMIERLVMTELKKKKDP